MGDFKAVSMLCTAEQFETIKEELVGLGCNVSSCDFLSEESVIINNFGAKDKRIASLWLEPTDTKRRKFIGEFNAELFLKHCGK